MDEKILIIDKEPTRLISTEDIVMPGGNGQHGPVVRIEIIHKEYEDGLSGLTQRIGRGRGITTLFKQGVLELGRHRRGKILRVIAEVLPGARDKFLGEDGLVVEITGRVSRERRRVA